jgi:hypothetical protein
MWGRAGLVAMLVAIGLPATAAAQDPLTIKGSKIVDGRGRQVILHGAAPE